MSSAMPHSGQSVQPLVLPLAPRRSTHQVYVGTVAIGSAAPIAIQSMTNTETSDVAATVSQVLALAQAGSDLVRLTVNDEAAARAVPEIAERLAQAGCSVPLVGDFHYNGHRLLAHYPECAQVLAKWRINPGNVGFGTKRDANFAALIELACRYDKPVRIGVNWGSLDQAVLARLMDENQRRTEPWPSAVVMREALVTSALESASEAERLGLPADRIVISAKVSSVPDLIAVYRELAARCRYPLHLGLTEAGMGTKGIVASTAALAVLLAEGIGDTIRVSLTPAPGESRTHEVLVAQQIVQSLGLRTFAPTVTACPGCGRTTSTFFQELAQRTETFLSERMPVWRARYDGVEQLRVAVMGCVVNGPGESRHAHIGISLPGTGEAPAAPVFFEGEKVVTLRGEGLTETFLEMIETYVTTRFAQKGRDE